MSPVDAIGSAALTSYQITAPAWWAMPRTSSVASQKACLLYAQTFSMAQAAVAGAHSGMLTPTYLSSGRLRDNAAAGSARHGTPPVRAVAPTEAADSDHSGSEPDDGSLLSSAFFRANR